MNDDLAGLARRDQGAPLPTDRPASTCYVIDPTCGTGGPERCVTHACVATVDRCYDGEREERDAERKRRDAERKKRDAERGHRPWLYGGFALGLAVAAGLRRVR